MNAKKPPLVIDMISDTVCPWCYVGFRGLDWAVMGLSFNYDISVRYRPYRLDPDIPPEGRDRAATIARKFPDAEQRAQVLGALKEAMLDVGLDFLPETPARIPDTTDSHRLIRWAQEEDKGREMKGALFDAYWQHGEDISHLEVLTQVVTEVGLDAVGYRERLKSPEDREAVRQDAAEYRGAGTIQGVPTFIVNEQLGFQGALPKAELLGGIRQLAEESTPPDLEEDD